MPTIIENIYFDNNILIIYTSWLHTRFVTINKILGDLEKSCQCGIKWKSCQCGIKWENIPILPIDRNFCMQKLTAPLREQILSNEDKWTGLTCLKSEQQEQELRCNDLDLDIGNDLWPRQSTLKCVRNKEHETCTNYKNYAVLKVTARWQFLLLSYKRVLDILYHLYHLYVVR